MYKSIGLHIKCCTHKFNMNQWKISETALMIDMSNLAGYFSRFFLFLIQLPVFLLPAQNSKIIRIRNEKKKCKCENIHIFFRGTIALLLSN